jgi:hypothetical protein
MFINDNSDIQMFALDTSQQWNYVFKLIVKRNDMIKLKMITSLAYHKKSTMINQICVQKKIKEEATATETATETEKMREKWHDIFWKEVEDCEECQIRRDMGYLFCKFHRKKVTKKNRETGYSIENETKQNNMDNRFKLLTAFLAVDINHSRSSEASPSAVLQKIREWNKDQLLSAFYYRNVG